MPPSFLLEGISDGQVEHHVGDVGGLVEHPFMSVGEPGISNRGSNIYPEDDDTEVKAQTGADAHSYIIQETAGEGGAYAGAVIRARPDITGVNEQRPADDGEQLGPVFEVHFQLDIPGLVRQVSVFVGIAGIKGTGAQRSCPEGADVVGAACEELFYERHGETIAIRDADASGDPGSQRAVSAKTEIVADIPLQPDVLGKGGVKNMDLLAFVEVGAREQPQQVA